MSKSSNALWVGAIIIVAALTAVELMSSRDEDGATESAENSTTDRVAAITPAPRQTDQTASGVNMESQEENELVDVIDPDVDFDPAVFQAPDLIVDLDNPDAYIASSDDDTLQETGSETNTTELAEQTTPADTSTTEAAPVEPETAADIQLSETNSPDASIDTAEAITPDLPPAGITTSATQSVTQHLADAEQAIKELRLTTPKGNNAQEHYEAILALDPDNVDAQAGMRKIVGMYIYFIEKAIADDKMQMAKVYLQRAELLQPGSAKLKNLRAELY
ncbi:MAG: hypothetical protein IT525_11240 [Nitrosomonas sp.]|jgi:hypothetical protein|nr:hypothetical protein [Nitrosomonas sp.]